MQIAAAAYPIDWPTRWNDYVGKLRLWVRTAAEGGAQALVFPEFAAIELASLAGDEAPREPARVIDALTARIGDVDDLHASLAREFGVLICAASGPLRDADGRVANRARIFAPDGGRGAQDKLSPDAEEAARWGVVPGGGAQVFATELGRVGVLLGRDVAEPGIAAALVAAGAALLLAPARAGSAEAAAELRAAALARAAETGACVALAMTQGDAAQAPALGASVGAAAIVTPAGEAAAGKADAPGWTQADVDLDAPPGVRRGAADGAGRWPVRTVALGAARPGAAP